MNIFITGGTGFIGRHAVEELKKRGHTLLILSRGRHRERGIKFIEGDLSDLPYWSTQLKKFKPDVAVHLAWEGIPDFSYENSLKNLSGSLALFSLLVVVGCKKIVATGTGFECGDRLGKIPDEIQVTPYSAFTAAKHALHIMGEELAKDKKLDFLWLRPFNPYGDGQRAESLIPYIMRCIMEGVPLRLRSPLAQGDFIYVGDVAMAIVKSIENGRGIHAYNVGSGHLTAVRDIAKMICMEMKVSEKYLKDFMNTTKGKLLEAPYTDIRQVKREIGWIPEVTMKIGIKKTIQAYKNI